MNDTKPSVKLTFHKPVIIDRWNGWEIVVDSLPVADFGQPENSTLTLAEGEHEIYLRHRLMPGVYSATQKLKIKLAKGDDVTIKLSIDPKLHLFVLFCLVMTLISFQSQDEAIEHIIQLSSVVIMGLSIFSIVKGFAHRLSIVEPQSSLNLASIEGTATKKRIEADFVVQRLASEFAKDSANKKSLPTTPSDSQITKNQLKDKSYYLMLFGILLFSGPPPFDSFAMVAFAVSAVVALIGSTWTKEHLLRISGYSAYLLASVIGTVVAFGSHLGNSAPTVFLTMSLCIGTALALNFGATIADGMKRSTWSGVFSLVLNSVLAVFIIQLMVPMLLQFIAQHI